MRKATVSIIGLGSFGQFVVRLLSKHTQVSLIGYDTDLATNTPDDISRVGSLEKAAQADIILLTIPLNTYETTLAELRTYLAAHTLLIDVCSVKVKPEQLIAQYLPDHQNILLTHPLFGPQSAVKSTAGHKLIITKSSGHHTRQVISFFEEILELDVSFMASDEHDRVMAQVHALTFFVARGLRNMDLPEVPFMTPSYQQVLDLIKLDAAHSEELYNTIETGNPYAAEMRQEFMASLHRV